MRGGADEEGTPVKVTGTGRHAAALVAAGALVLSGCGTERHRRRRRRHGHHRAGGPDGDPADQHWFAPKPLEHVGQLADLAHPAPSIIKEAESAGRSPSPTGVPEVDDEGGEPRPATLADRPCRERRLQAIRTTDKSRRSSRPDPGLTVTVNPRYGTYDAELGDGRRRPPPTGCKPIGQVTSSLPGLVLLVVSPRVVPGLLSRAAWQALDAADSRLARDLAEPLAVVRRRCGSRRLGHRHARGRTSWPAILLERATDERVVWLGSADGDPGLTDALTAEIGRRPRRRGLRRVRPGDRGRRRLVGRPGCPAPRRRGGHGPAPLAGRLPMGCRADPRVPRAVPHRGGARGARGRPARRPDPPRRGAR